MFDGFWAFLAWGAGLYFADSYHAANFVPVLSAGLLFAAFYWQLTPLLTGGFGASLDSRRLLIYPIPRSRLFAVELLLRLTSSAEMLMLIAGAAIGLLLNPQYGPRAAPAVLGGAVIFVAVNLLAAAGTRSLVEELFLRGHLREALLFLLVMGGLGSRAFLIKHLEDARLLRFAPDQIYWPWGAAARLMLRQPGTLSFGILVIYLVGAYAWSRRQFYRGLVYDGTNGKQRDGAQESNGGLTEQLFRMPGSFLPDPWGALVEKEMRTLWRIPRFRMIYAMSSMFGIVMFLPVLSQSRPGSFFLRNALPLMAFYGLLMLGPISYWNSFGFDREATQGYFSWPVGIRQVLVAKNLTVALLLIPQILMVSVVAGFMRFPVSAGKIVETVAVILIGSVYWFAMGNICSVRMPRAMDPGKMNQMANKLQALSIWSAPLLLLPIVLAYWAREVLGSEVVFAGVLAIAAIIGGIVYRVGLDSAAHTAVERREEILLQLSRSEGPLSTG